MFSKVPTKLESIIKFISSQQSTDMERARQDVLHLFRVLLSLSTGNENKTAAGE
jgi:hypothetical protein